MDSSKQLAADQALVEAYLKQEANTWPQYGQLAEAMSYSLMAGGKRIRPVLVLEVCRLLGGDVNAALPFACGLEMIHTYSLIHDDLPCMDDDDFRRGKPTNHKVYGEALAVLAGDGLLTAAFTSLTRSSLPADRICRAVGCLSRLAGPEGMVGGQVLDLLGEGQDRTYEEIIQTELLKTGCMIEAAARLGAISAGSTAEQEEAVAEYARKIGLAFQIQDDILDVLGDEAQLGKPIGSDQENAKATFVALKGIPACKKLVEDLTAQAVEALQPFAHNQFLVDLAYLLSGRKH